MSDEAPRSAHSSGQRRSDGAPAWWAALDRADLPQDEAGDPAPRWYSHDGGGRRTDNVAAQRRRTWIINLAAILAAVAVIMLGVGVDSPRSALIVGLLFGVPVMLVAITAAVAVRRSRG